MNKKVYTSPLLTLTTVSSCDVIAASGLTYGGENGKPVSESFSSMFGK